MEITDDLINKLAKLSKLSFEANEKDEIKEDLQKMLNFIDDLKKVDVEGVEPLIHMTAEINRLREDKPEAPLKVEEVLQNAPEKNGDFFQVPKVVKKG